jgi:hypothetical protein
MCSSVIIVAGLVVASTCAFEAMPAAAQQADSAAISVPAPSDGLAAPQAETPLTPEEAAALSNALAFDPATLDARPAKPLRLPGSANADHLAYSHSAKPDGTGTMTVNKPFAGDWDAKVGADVTLTPDQSLIYRPDKPLPGIGGNQDTGAAWASVGMNNFASVDARVDPGNDQGKLGTTLKRAIPLGSKYSVTLQDTYSVTQSVGAAATPSTIPLMTAPAGATATPAPQVWSNQRGVRFDVLFTGTTFGAGIATASNDPVTHNTFSADQKIYGPLHVTTAVTDFGQTTTSKSVSAGLKLHW